MGERARVGARRLRIFAMGVVACVAVQFLTSWQHAPVSWTQALTGLVALAASLWMFGLELRARGRHRRP